MPSRILSEPVTPEALTALIGSETREGTTIDFKRALNLEKQGATLELAADVASFANAHGGDVIFGMDEDGDGRASQLVGLEEFSADRFELRIRQICAAKIEPLVPGLRFIPVQFAQDSFALVLRIPRSWNRPHAVMGDPLRFPVRDGNGKRSVKLHELRELFGLSASLTERLNRFLTGRIGDLMAGVTPISIASRSLIVLHVMPLSAFDSPETLDVKSIDSHKALLTPIGPQASRAQINFEGILISYGEWGGTGSSYVQAFRDGCIESVNAHILTYDNDRILIGYEKKVEEALGNYMKFLKAVGLEPPVFVSLSLLGAKGKMFQLPDGMGGVDNTGAIDRDPLVLPPFEIPAYGDDYHEVLRGTFDRVWQACGRWGSVNYEQTAAK